MNQSGLKWHVISVRFVKKSTGLPDGERRKVEAPQALRSHTVGGVKPPNPSLSKTNYARNKKVRVLGVTSDFNLLNIISTH